jgi:hypothetical protein
MKSRSRLAKIARSATTKWLIVIAVFAIATMTFFLMPMMVAPPAQSALAAHLPQGVSSDAAQPNGSSRAQPQPGAGLAAANRWPHRGGAKRAPQVYVVGVTGIRG